MEKKKRRDTTLPSEGAEFLVVGNLLLRGIPAYKAYTNMPDYDVVAVNPEAKKSVRVQVKSRYDTEYDGFPIRKDKVPKCDFVVCVALNRGYNDPKNGPREDGVKPPDFYIFPSRFLADKITDTSVGKFSFAWQQPKKKSAKAEWKKIAAFQDRWDLISKKLKIPPKQ